MVASSKKSTILSTINRYLSWPILGLIIIYQYVISPLTGPRCRFYPSCSKYTQTAYLRFGLIKGSFLSIKRLGKCHPWHEGGVDLVPDDNDAQD
ncbi:MAG: putative membrane protein insertion efficiency factor [Candidatus Endobugula sp.]|jgi:putative membrane protein insertion efficiency factor